MTPKFRLLIARLLGETELISPVNITTEPPIDTSEYCRHCYSNEDCEGYVTNSTCTEGQCTNEEGLFGPNCVCEDASECSTGRCDGFFVKKCLTKLSNEDVCSHDDDCVSGWCKDNILCADPMASTAAPKITYVVGDPQPLPLATTSPKAQPCDACLTDSECDGGACSQGLCTDAFGELPSYCGHCRDHQDCIDGYYCAANGLIGGTGKFCQRKKSNGGRCNDNDVSIFDPNGN
jgi:hypothetical protein